jgi:WD40 repeat protein
MMASTLTGAGRIFISYRREETAYPAGWLFDRLVEHFGQGQVFKDVDSIQLGDDFVEVITAAVARCNVLLALIGDRWLTITGEDGRRRLEDPDDFVRLEIEAALTRNVRVIPVLVEGARMPRVADLPPSLAKLVRRQALELSPSRFTSDTGQLLRVLDSSLAEAQAQQPGTEPEAPVPPSPAGHDTDTHRTSVSAQARDRAAAPGAPAAKSPGPDTADIQEAREAADSRVRRVLFPRSPRRRAAAVTGLGVALVAAVTVTVVLTTQTSQTTGQTSGTTGAGHTAEVSGVAFNRDGTILASGSYDRTVRLWNPATQKRIGQPFEGQRGQLMTVALSPDGKIVASGGYDQTVQLWSTTTRKTIAILHGQTGRVNSVAFSPNGKLLASGSDDDTVLLRDAATRARVKFIHAHSGGVFAVAFSPDSKILATGGKDGTVRLWNAATGQPIGQALRGQNGRVNSVAFSPGGKILASGSQDGTVRLWDTTARRSHVTLSCHNPVLSVAFSYDGKTLACAEDFDVLLWNSATHKRMGPPLAVCRGGVLDLAFSPVSNTLAIGCANNIVRLWDTDTGEQIGKNM